MNKNGLIGLAGAVALAALVTVSGLNSRVAHSADDSEVEILFVGDQSSSAWAGASQGLVEANTQGKFLGKTFKLVHLPGPGSIIGQSAPAAVVVAGDAGTINQVAKALPHTAVFDVSLDDDATRKCGGNTLHVLPSKSMKRDALSQWKSKNPDSDARPLAWHSSAVKYSGEQLNQRYSRAYGKPMDEEAWAGWAAVKLLSDSVVRSNTSNASKLLDFIETQLEFDGQKGVNMSFRPNGQLRQTIMLVEGEKIVGEAPVKGVAKSVEDLDSLGDAPCK
ncbi:MAG: hypothetical protein U1F34_05985 [Gammaproteobacteria bacterium]